MAEKSSNLWTIDRQIQENLKRFNSYKMYDSFIEISNPILSIIIVFVSLGISGHIYFGIGSRNGAKYLYILALAILIGCQLFYLLEAVSTVPSSLFYIYDTSLVRDSCLQNGKGGKRPKDDTSIRFLDPCFCSHFSICKLLSGEIYNSSSCPSDGSVQCFDVDGIQINEYLDISRNCKGGMSARCSLMEPCFPCERQRLPEFGGYRCASCTNEYSGNCNFIPNIGPYCYKSNSSKEVEPCSTCCTDPEPLIINNKCY